MKHAQITVMTEQGEHVWDGSLLQFARDNGMDREEIADLIAELRAEQAPAWIGGGAAPAFMILLVA